MLHPGPGEALGIGRHILDPDGAAIESRCILPLSLLHRRFLELSAAHYQVKMLSCASPCPSMD